MKLTDEAPGTRVPGLLDPHGIDLPPGDDHLTIRYTSLKGTSQMLEHDVYLP